ncbi:Nitrate reductase [Metarhizium album ARSEF 1941]|uniref:Nitrate reductase n=1 Tax=Metarhizium album (strain ARSEF 1941) TaxID=1081103 RepID=A0A0B2WWS1_METAS|nr:Nitrate reductase [Metarhizium album ARSEF 1941]KHN97872.1 Nitrate reductase [Metarhizium album ARSEF 1941]
MPQWRSISKQGLRGAAAVTQPPSPPSTAGRSPRCSVDGHPNDVAFPVLPTPENYFSSNYALPPTNSQKSVRPEDLKTPDSHVERDARLIRLTGTHPFNCEPPLSDLYDEGFLTSEDLHYVRNHGPVPKCDDDTMNQWEVAVEGLVENPFSLSVGELIAEYEQLTYPITLVCAGNRRKEQNVVRKSKGFSWGPAGLSTALWTGVALGDLIAKARPRRGARYVCFEGADKLPNGYYGTSVKLNWCLDPNRGIMVAHKMNGCALHPDHGKPVRVVIPGQIGGRSVKWLRRIIITEEPSDNWYHIYDNRVLPTMVTPEASVDLPDTWRDERYAIYDLNTNGVICYPAHNEKLLLNGNMRTYKVRGYAYGGGGKRVTRMEVTLDSGKSWRLANIDYPEDRYRLAPDGQRLYGGRIDMWWRETSFCWCFWELDVDIEDLKSTTGIMVRAMDESLMVQPRDMYWSVLGMMNNPWFRIVVRNDGHALWFEHPTQPALIPGGWMERIKKAGGNLTNGSWGEKLTGQTEDVIEPEPEMQACMTNPCNNRLVTMGEMRSHSGEQEPWFIVNGQVYDGTQFLNGHSGGAASIFGAAGQDVTEEFVAIHSENARAMMPAYHIGKLSQDALAQLPGEANECDPKRAVFLGSKVWTKATLQEKISVSPDSKIFRFKLDHAGQEVGLPVGQHLIMRLRDPVTREPIIRAYTPISEGTDRGWLDVLIKIYHDTPERKGGKMTQALDSTPIGHFVDFKGPVGKFEYLGKGLSSIYGKSRQVSRFNMICGGSGITPIFRVFRAMMQDVDDLTECVILDGNRAEEDILCRLQLDQLASIAKHRCNLLHCLSRPSSTWEGRTGRIDKDLISREIGPPRLSNDDVVLICGPEQMEKSVCDILRDLGWPDDNIVVF